MGARDLELEALLARLGIPSPAPRVPHAQGYASLGNSPRPDALGSSFATPQRPASAGTLLSTPASKAGGVLGSQPTPSLLDKYLPGGARPDLGPSRLGAGAPSAATPSHFSAAGKLSADPLTAFYSPWTGSSGTPQQAGASLMGPASSGAAAYGWDPPVLSKAGAGLYPVPAERQAGPGGEFSISALRRGAFDATASSSAGRPSSNSSGSTSTHGDISISLRLTAPQAAAIASSSTAVRAPSRLGQAAICSSHSGMGAGPPTYKLNPAAADVAGAAKAAAAVGLSASAGPSSWAQSPRSAAHQLASQSSTDLTGYESSANSLYDGLQGGMYRATEGQLGAGSMASGPRSAQGVPSMVGGAGASTEYNILHSRVHELQAQLRLRDLEEQKTASKFADLQRQHDELQDKLQRANGELANWQWRCKNAEALQMEQQQAAATLRETLQSREGAHGTSAAAVSKLQGELEAERRGAEALRLQLHQAERISEQRERETAQLRAALQDADKGSAADLAAARAQIEDLLAEGKRVWGQYQTAQVEKLASQKQAELAAERCRLAEDRCQQLERDMRSVEQGAILGNERLDEAQRQVSTLQQRVTSLSDQLAATNEQCERAQAALAQERQSSAQQRRHSSVSQQSEAALAAQVKSMAEQLKQLQSEAAALREENANLRQRQQWEQGSPSQQSQVATASQVKAMAAQIEQLEAEAGALREAAEALRDDNTDLRHRLLDGHSPMQDEFVALEAKVACLQQENRVLKAKDQKAAIELESKMKCVEDQRLRMKQLQGENAALQEEFRTFESDLAKQRQQAVSLQAQIDRMAEERARLQQELRESKGKVAELEALLAKSGRKSSGEASPLNAVVASLREELHEKELALVSLGEQLAAEKRTAAELQKQVWDQAVELDELQRKQSDDFSLSQQLAAARQAEVQLRKRVGELSQALTAAQQQAQQTGAQKGSRACNCEALPASSTASGVNRPTASSLARTNSLRAESPRASGRSSSPSQSSSRNGSPRPTSGLSRAESGGRQQLDRAAAGAGMGAGGGEQQRGGGGVSSEEAEALKQELARLRKEKERLQAVAEAKEGEVMQLQGQVRILQEQATEAENWLTS